VLMLGDNIYGGLFGRGGGHKKDFEKKFDRPYAALLERGVRFRAALGNHDDAHRHGQDEIDSYERFHIDGPLGYYSFTSGQWTQEEDEPRPLVEFFVLNTNRIEKDKRDPEQLAWLEQALAASRARWRIVYGHHPLYASARAHGGDVRLREKLLPLLLAPSSPPSLSPVAPATGSGSSNPPEAGALRPRSGHASGLGVESGGKPRVHVVLAGHDHIYQRFKPQNGIIYFVCGSSGKLRRGNARPGSQVAAANDRERAFMLWEATASELRFRAINERGQAFDCGMIRPNGAAETVACSAAVTLRRQSAGPPRHP
ncbi:MAG: metallophosphoesterase, partial [Terriglobia bacterium]